MKALRSQLVQPIFLRSSPKSHAESVFNEFRRRGSREENLWQTELNLVNLARANKFDKAIALPVKIRDLFRRFFAGSFVNFRFVHPRGFRSTVSHQG